MPHKSIDPSLGVVMGAIFLESPLSKFLDPALKVESFCKK